MISSPWISSFRILVAAALAIGAVGCDSPVSQPLGAVAGSYTLVAVNGQPLPASVTSAGATLVIYSGALDLSSDGAVVSHHNQGPPPVAAGGATVSSSGNWSSRAAAVQLTLHGDDLAGVFSATFAPGVLTVTVAQGRVEKFTK